MKTTYSVTGAFRPIGSHGQVADLSSAVTMTPPDGAGRLLMQPLTQNITYTLDGTAPTAAKGFVVAAGVVAEIVVGDAMTIKVIEVAASASLEYQWGV